MANEFIIKNGFHSKGNSQVTGSLEVTEGITGSFSGDGSGITGTVTSASYAITASHALNAGGGGSTFPFSGSAVITGSLIIEDTSTSELFRVTQKGTGDAIRIEDTTNPDSTPTVVTATGDILIGTGSGAGGNTKLYVKEGDAGSLALGTGNTVIVESDTTNYIAMVAPDANLSGMVMGSPSDGFGAFIRWGLDTQRVQIGAARTNHSIEFTVGNKGATSMQLTPDTTGTSNYNATLTVTGSLVVSGSTQINTTAGILYDESSVDSIRYIQRGLFSSNGALSVQYDTRKLYRNDGTTISYDWENAEINDDGGTLAIDLGERKLHDRFGTEIGSFTTTGTAYLSGSLIGTASYADNATSASYAISASHLIGGGGGSDPAININANGTTLTEVTSDSDLPTTLAANTTYLIRGNVATGKTLNVTNEGTSVIGIGRNQSHLSYTGSNELFNVHDQSFSIKSLTMKSSGSIMTAKNVSPGAPYNDGRTKVLDIKDCQVKNTNDVMEVHGFELVDLNNVLFWYITGSQGLSFQSVRHLEISSCEFYNWYDEVATGSFAPSGTKMVEIRPNTGSVNTPVVNINSSIFHPEQGQIGLYIDSGSETLFGTVASNTFIDVNGGTLLAGSNYDSGSMLKYDIGINQGLEDSKAYLYGYQNGTDAQGATTSYTQLSIASFSTNIETRMSASTAGITYIGTKPIDVMFQINVGVNDVGGNNEQFDFALYKNTNIINGSERRIELDSGEEGNIVTFALTNIVQNDLLTVYYKSPTNDNFTLQNFSIIIKE